MLIDGSALAYQRRWRVGTHAFSRFVAGLTDVANGDRSCQSCSRASLIEKTLQADARAPLRAAFGAHDIAATSSGQVRHVKTCRRMQARASVRVALGCARPSFDVQRAGVTRGDIAGGCESSPACCSGASSTIPHFSQRCIVELTDNVLSEVLASRPLIDGSALAYQRRWRVGTMRPADL